ncbi:ABC-2 transporter permease [Microbacterium sp. BWT-B31]|uniref:ABC-2 transporter permease n=1 Tax=Microbacterium sp. BWT-B31 TaxID=3232072 RepID=UPI0035274B3D
MPSVARFIRLDLRSLRPYARNLIIPVVIILVAAVLPTRSPYAMIPAPAVFAVIIAPQYLFGNDERGRLDTLYTALGIARRQVVTGRYATSLLLLIGLTAAGLILAPVTALLLRVELDWAIAAALAAGSVGIVGALLAVELPVYFALGATRARTVGFAVPAAIILAVVFAGWAFPDAGTTVLGWLEGTSPGWLALAALAILAVLGTASSLLAARLYARRDL